MTQDNNSPQIDSQPANEEQIYSNINYEEQQYSNLPNQTVTTNEEQAANTTALVGNENCDLAEYIEDTKIRAIALYDYQASAEDEISFDPNDIITHIEQVKHLKLKYIKRRLKNEMLFHRLMRAGGVDCVRTVMDCFQPTMFSFRSNIVSHSFQHFKCLRIKILV